MAVGGYVCALIFISAAAAGGRLEKPSRSVVAELLRSPAHYIVEMEYCPPTLEDQVLEYSESHSQIPLLCLQASNPSQVNHKNGEILEIVVLQLEISADGIKAIVESIQWNSLITASDQSPHKSEVMFDSNWTDDPNYQRWKRFLLKKLKLPPSYFRVNSSQGSFPRLKRQNTNNNDSGTSNLLATIAQNIGTGLRFAQSLKAKIEQTSKQTKTVEKRIKRLSSTLSSTSELDIVELQERGKRVERLFTSINNEMTTLQKQNQDLKHNIDDFNVQLTAANISQEHKDKGPLYHVSFNGDGYAMLESPVYNTSFSFSIVFRTSTPDGLLFFSSNNSMEYWYSLVLSKGKLVFRHKLVDGVIEIQSATENMNDDKWHRLDGVKTTGSLQFYVDQKLVGFNSIVTSFLASVTWGPLYVGGIPDRPFYHSQGISIASFTGCLENITFNQKLQDFRNSVGLKNTVFGCTREEKKPPTKPYYFNGNGYALYKLPNGGVGKNLTLKLEFKTSKREGILFSASSNKLRDAMALEMRFGKLLYYLDNGDGGFMVQYQGKKLHDNKWHTLLAEKWASSLKLTVDDDPPEIARFAGSDQITDTSTSLYIGGLPPKSRLPDGLTTDANFIGCMKLEELESHQCTLVQLQGCTS